MMKKMGCKAQIYIKIFFVLLGVIIILWNIVWSIFHLPICGGGLFTDFNSALWPALEFDIEYPEG
jgi:hypothetical protein